MAKKKRVSGGAELEYGKGREAIKEFLKGKKVVKWQELYDTLENAGYKDPESQIYALRNRTNLLDNKTVTPRPVVVGTRGAVFPDRLFSITNYGKDIVFKIPADRRKYLKHLRAFTKDDQSKWKTTPELMEEFKVSQTDVENANRVLRKKIPALKKGSYENRTNRRYAPIMEDMGLKGKFINLKKTDQQRVWRQEQGPTTSWTATKIGGKTYPLSSAISKESTEKLINFFDDWKKNPTKENLSKLHRDLYDTTHAKNQISEFIKYVKGEELKGFRKDRTPTQTLDQWAKIKDTLLTSKEQNVLKGIPKGFIQAQSVKDLIKTYDPVRMGTNDQTAIVKYFIDNPEVSQSQALKDLAQDPEVQSRAKNKGEKINDRYLKTRIHRTYQQAIRKQIDQVPTRHPALKNYDALALNTFGKNAYRLFRNDIERGIETVIANTYKPGSKEFNAATQKISAFRKMTSAFDKAFPEYKFRKGRGSGLIQFDHPISFAALEKGKGLDGALKVNPIQGDVNQVKEMLDRQLNTLRNRGIKGKEVTSQLNALQDINKTLFGKQGGRYKLTPEGVFKNVEYAAPEFIDAQLLTEFKQNVGLGEQVRKNLGALKKSGLLEQAGFAEGQAEKALTRFGETTPWKSGKVIKFVDQWMRDNPDLARTAESTMNEIAGRKICKDGCFIKVGKNNPGLLQRTLQKLAGKGGRFGILAGAIGAVGGGTWAMMGDAEADETRITDQSTMKYNSTTGTFENTETGDPETQTGILDWIADNPVKGGLVALPAFMGAGYGLSAAGMKKAGQHLMSWKAVIPAMMIPEKMHQWKTGMEAGEMITDPFNAIWALGIDSKASALKKASYYIDLIKEPKLKAKLLKDFANAGTHGAKIKIGQQAFAKTGAALFGKRFWKNPEKMAKIGRSIMGPAAGGTNLAMGTWGRKPFVAAIDALKGQAGKKGLGYLAKRGALMGAAALAAPFAAIPAGIATIGLLGADLVYGQYKDYRDGKAIVDGMRAKGKISEEDADNYLSLIRQGSLPFGLGNRLFGDDEMTIRGQMLNPDQQRQLLAGMEDQIDLFQDKRQDVRALDREDDFDFFSEGGRVGMKFGGGMDRRGFLKWLAGLGATIAGGASGLFKSGGKQVIKEVAKQAPKQFVGVPGMPAWFPRAVQKIKTHGKLIEMADKDYVNGDIYEMIIPVKVKRSLSGRPDHNEIVTVQKKVTLEENPLSGEIEMSWSVDDFDGEMTRQINFKPGESGFQKFGSDPEYPNAWEYERVKVEEPEFTYGNPNQADPERADFDYKDIFEEGDEVVKGLEDLTGNKKMVAKDGSIIDTVDEKGVDEAFQKKIFKDIEGEAGLIPDPEGHMTPDGWQGEGSSEIVGGDIPEWVPRDTWTKKAGGGTVETGDIARRQSSVPPLSGPDPQGIMGLYSSPKQVRVG